MSAIEKAILELKKQIADYTVISKKEAHGFTDCDYYRREGEINAAADYVIDLKKILAILEP